MSIEYILNLHNMNNSDLFQGHNIDDKVQSKQKLSKHTRKQQPFPAISQILKPHLKTGFCLSELGLNKLQSHQQVQEAYQILNNILAYPQLHLGKYHKQCSRLGNFDVDDTNQVNIQNCQCCGKKIQNRSIPMIYSIEQIKNIGLSTYLYFKTYIKISILLAVLAIFYSIFALATNLKAATSTQIQAYKIDLIAISLSSKLLNDTSENKTFNLLQCLFGLIIVILWIPLLLYLKVNQNIQVRNYDKGTISPSDYTLIVEGIPNNLDTDNADADNADTDNADKNKFKDEFINFFKCNNQVWNRYQDPDSSKIQIYQLIIASKINKQTENQIIKQNKQKINQIKNILIQEIKFIKEQGKFRKAKKQRQDLYNSYAALKQQHSLITNEVVKSNPYPTIGFIILQNMQMRYAFQQLLSDKLLTKIVKVITCKDYHFIYQYKNKSYPIQLSRAPEPEDIIWQNIGTPNCEVRMRQFITFMATLILLTVSFFIVMELNLAQNIVQNDKTQSDSKVISFVISLIITIVNILLKQLIYTLTALEPYFSNTKRQASFAIKSILAQTINSIVIPVVVAYKIKDQNIYKANGLVDTIFLLAITNSLVPPLMTLIDPIYQIKKIKRCYYTDPIRRLNLSQKEFNILQEGGAFQVGDKYTFQVGLFLFTCFFVSLHPIIPFISLIGLFVGYWVDKYCLLNRCKRPIPGSNFVHKTIFHIVGFGGIAFSLGNLTWFNFFPNIYSPITSISNFVGLAVSLVLVFFPYSLIARHNFINDDLSNEQMAEMKVTYPLNRTRFTSEYQLQNPKTKQKTIKQIASQINKEPNTLLKDALKEKLKKQLKKCQKNQIEKSLTVQINGLLSPDTFPKKQDKRHHRQLKQEQTEFNAENSNIKIKETQSFICEQQINLDQIQIHSNNSCSHFEENEVQKIQNKNDL